MNNTVVDIPIYGGYDRKYTQKSGGGGGGGGDNPDLEHFFPGIIAPLDKSLGFYIDKDRPAGTSIIEFFRKYVKSRGLTVEDGRIEVLLNGSGILASPNNIKLYIHGAGGERTVPYESSGINYIFGISSSAQLSTQITFADNHKLFGLSRDGVSISESQAMKRTNISSSTTTGKIVPITGNLVYTVSSNPSSNLSALSFNIDKNVPVYPSIIENYEKYISTVETLFGQSSTFEINAISATAYNPLGRISSYSSRDSIYVPIPYMIQEINISGSKLAPTISFRCSNKSEAELRQLLDNPDTDLSEFLNIPEDKFNPLTDIYITL